MLALMLLAAVISDNNPSSVQSSAIASQVKASEEQTTDSAVPQDWAGPAAKRPGPDENVKNFDPNRALYTKPNLCVIVKGEPLPDCAKVQAGQAISVNDDILSTNVGGASSTCRSVPVSHKDSSGSYKQVYITTCGDDAPKSLSNSTSSPTGAQSAPNIY